MKFQPGDKDKLEKFVHDMGLKGSTILFPYQGVLLETSLEFYFELPKNWVFNPYSRRVVLFTHGMYFSMGYDKFFEGIGDSRTWVEARDYLCSNGERGLDNEDYNTCSIRKFDHGGSYVTSLLLDSLREIDYSTRFLSIKSLDLPQDPGVRKQLSRILDFYYLSHPDRKDHPTPVEFRQKCNMNLSQFNLISYHNRGTPSGKYMSINGGPVVPWGTYIGGSPSNEHIATQLNRYSDSVKFNPISSSSIRYRDCTRKIYPGWFELGSNNFGTVRMTVCDSHLVRGRILEIKFSCHSSSLQDGYQHILKTCREKIDYLSLLSEINKGKNRFSFGDVYLHVHKRYRANYTTRCKNVISTYPSGFLDASTLETLFGSQSLWAEFLQSLGAPLVEGSNRGSCSDLLEGLEAYELRDVGYDASGTQIDENGVRSIFDIDPRSTWPNSDVWAEGSPSVRRLDFVLRIRDFLVSLGFPPPYTIALTKFKDQIWVVINQRLYLNLTSIGVSNALTIIQHYLTGLSEGNDADSLSPDMKYYAPTPLMRSVGFPEAPRRVKDHLDELLYGDQVVVSNTW